MKKWTVGYYRTQSGECPIEEFIESRDTRNQAKIFGWLDQLELQCPNLPRAFAGLLRNGIHELRVKLSGESSKNTLFLLL